MCVEAQPCGVIPGAEAAAVMVICVFRSGRAGCDGVSGCWAGAVGRQTGWAVAGLLARAEPRRWTPTRENSTSTPRGSHSGTAGARWGRGELPCVPLSFGGD